MSDLGETAAWRVPGEEEQDLRRYWETVRERWRLIALIVVATVLAAALYVALAERRYEATADLLVTPVPRVDERLGALGLIRDSNDPTRDVETAARLVTTTDVARRVQRILRVERSPDSLLDDVETAPVAQSYVVAITGKSPDARDAARIANAFGAAVVEERTATLHEQLDKVIERLRARVGGRRGRRPADDPVRTRLSEYEALRAGDDPTLHLESRADVPGDPAWPKPGLTLLAGLLAGLVLGVGAAFLAQALDPKLRREGQLRRQFRAPIGARVPRQRAGGEGPIPPRRLSRGAVDAYRALRALLEARSTTEARGGEAERGPLGGSPLSGRPRSVAVTAPASGAGTSTSALGLAASLAASGSRVVLIEGDLRQPALKRTLGIGAGDGLESVLAEERVVGDALVRSTEDGPNLSLLLVDRASPLAVDRLSLASVRKVLDEAGDHADWVVIDAPPPSSVPYSLSLLEAADQVLVVARVGKSRLDELARLAESLGARGIEPAAVVVLGSGADAAEPGGGTESGPVSRAEPPERASALAAR